MSDGGNNRGDGGNDGSDGSDEWGTAELVMPPPSPSPAPEEGEGTALAGIWRGRSGNDGGDRYWANAAPAVETVKNRTSKIRDVKGVSQGEEEEAIGEPMIIVDLTLLSEGAVHSRYDRNSVNDPAAASALRKRIEADYLRYARSEIAMVSDGTVVPCGSSVYRGALARLRDERPGHYFAPVFPPKEGREREIKE